MVGKLLRDIMASPRGVGLGAIKGGQAGPRLRVREGDRAAGAGTQGRAHCQGAAKLFLLAEEDDYAAHEYSVVRAFFLHGLLGCYNTARATGRTLQGEELLRVWRARVQSVLVARPKLQRARSALLK